ncbi:MAG: helix-turn-helix domain-containing protein [Roseobacter sp.]
MDDTTLVSFPLPMATAFLCAAIAIVTPWLDLGARRANCFFVTFFTLSALVSFLVGLRFGYGIDGLVQLQRILPLFLGPTLFLGFASLANEKRSLSALTFPHLGIPIVLLVIVIVVTQDLRHLDAVISASYAVYCIMLYVLWRKGPDALIHARVDVTRTLSKWLLRGVGFLFFIFVLDSVIAIDFALHQGKNVSKLISFGTVPLVLGLLVTLIVLPLVFSHPRAPEPEPSAFDPEDSDIVLKLQTLMQEYQVFLDPDMSVQRLAKRLSLPARAVSGAINRTQGLNMSQYVNSFRLSYAAQILIVSDISISKISEQCGFVARSNFYREFQRVYGMSPREYRVSNVATEKLMSERSNRKQPKPAQ